VALEFYGMFPSGSGGIGAARKRPAPGDDFPVLYHGPEGERTAAAIKPYVAGESPGLNIPGWQGYCYVPAFAGQRHRPRAVSRRDLYLYAGHPFMPGDKIQEWQPAAGLLAENKPVAADRKFTAHPIGFLVDNTDLITPGPCPHLRDDHGVERLNLYLPDICGIVGLGVNLERRFHAVPDEKVP